MDLLGGGGDGTGVVWNLLEAECDGGGADNLPAVI